MLSDGLFSLLAGAPSIVAIVGTPAARAAADREHRVTTGVFPLQMPESTPMPAIVFWQVPSGATLMTMDGPDPFRIARWQFSCYAKDYETSKKLAAAVRSLLDNFTGILAGGAELQNAQTLLEGDTFEEAPFIYHTPIDVQISYVDA